MFFVPPTWTAEYRQYLSWPVFPRLDSASLQKFQRPDWGTMNTTQVGDKFRDEIAMLLQLAGFSRTVEILEGHKRVDIIFERMTFGKRRRYALEAKNWQLAPDHGDLATIFGGHASLILSNQIDEVLVVSPRPLTSPAAKAFIRDTPGISYLSFNEFQESLMGFQGLLATFVSNHEAEGLEHYFVTPTFVDFGAAEDYIDEWINSEAANPIAVIASYGMGKTSLARHVAYKHAKKFLAGQPSRIPLLISLGMISREQSLEGLVGSLLAGRSPSVTNYNFPLFMELNRCGRFLVLLDGFDEMKHMMTRAEFSSNFDQINRLAAGNAKVVLLGRPNAFLSDTERSYALRGTYTLGRTALRTPGAPQYDELNLASFSGDQVSRFVQQYLEHHRRLGNINVSDEFIDRRLREISSKGHAALLSRPVHARMIADIATDASSDISGLSRLALYDHFVDHLIKRELAKPGRGTTYKAEDRRQFACDLAWHLWTRSEPSRQGCRIDELPDTLFEPYLVRNEDSRAVRRELMSSSFLDEKLSGVYFFAHRSFHEFLVSEHIWNIFTSDDSIDDAFIDLLVASATQDIFDFIVERADRDFFRSFLSRLNKSRRVTRISFVHTISMVPTIRVLAEQRNRVAFSSLDAWILIAHAASLEGSKQVDAIRKATSAIVAASQDKPQLALSSILFLVGSCASAHIDLEAIIPSVMALLFHNAANDVATMAVEAPQRSCHEKVKDIIALHSWAEFADDSGRIAPMVMVHLDLLDVLDAIMDICEVNFEDLVLTDVPLDPCNVDVAACISNMAEGVGSIVKHFYTAQADLVRRR